MKRILQIQNKAERCNLYTDISRDIYEWIHRESYRLNTSKAKFIESCLRKMMNQSTSNWIPYKVIPYVDKSS